MTPRLPPTTGSGSSSSSGSAWRSPSLRLPPVVGVRGTPLTLPLAYLAVVALAELAHRWRPRLTSPLLSALVLVDGAFLAAAVLLTGGTTSPLLFLAFLEVVAVTLLASPRTGLKLAVWCALLFFLGRTAAVTGVLRLSASGDDRAAALSGTAFLLFAVGAAVFQSFNERALRRTGSELMALVDLGRALDAAPGPADLVTVLIEHLRQRLGFVRVVVFVRGDDAWVVSGDAAAPGPHSGGLGRVADAVLADGTACLVRSLGGGLLAEQLPRAQNVVVAALTGEDEPLGVVAAEWGHGPRARIPELTVASVQQSVAHAALTLRNARLLTEVQRLATRDELTGLANRRLFEETLILEVGRHRRTGAPLSVGRARRRPLQAHQRRMGPSGRRRRAATGRRCASRRHEGLRRPGPLRRRRVLGAAARLLTRRTRPGSPSGSAPWPARPSSWARR